MASGTTQKITPESGSGYCKMPDGTMIVWGIFAFPSASAAGTVSASVSFPMTFSSAPTIVMTWRDTRGAPTYCGSLNSRNITGSGFTADAYYNQGGYSWSASYLAVGRWK